MTSTSAAVPLTVGNIRIGPGCGGGPLLIIAGPCVIESLDQCLDLATRLRDRCDELGLQYIFKASYDKANRSSIHSPRGPGLERGVEILAQVSERTGVPVTTDIHEPRQAAVVAEAAHLLQIPAFLCRQTDLLQAAAQTGRPINVKKGQFVSPAEMTHVIGKINEARGRGEGEKGGVGGVMVTERGTFFGYNRLVNDFVGLGDLLELGPPHPPVCFDVTHSTQSPGGQGHQSGGRPERADLLARAAVAAGVHAVFIETHPDPPRALSDAAVQLPIERTLGLLEELARLHEALTVV